VESRHGFTFEDFGKDGILLSKMLTQVILNLSGLMNEQIPQTKEMIVENIVECIKVESYPTDANKGFMKANITDIVLLIVLHILRAFQFGTSPSHNLSLQKMSDIITRDCKMGGSQEYLGIDLIGTSN